MTTNLLTPLPRFAKDDYGPIADRLKGVRRTYADKRGWGPGWPNPQMDKIHVYEANRIGHLKVREEIAPLLTYLIKAANALGYDMRKTSERDGGLGSFANRPIKHSKPPAPSNHSWGLAIDQNTRSNPMSKRWQSSTPPEVVDLWESSGFYWGGRYPVPPWFHDPMHAEYLGTPQDVAADMRNAEAAFARLGGTTLYPTLIAGAPNVAMVRVLQYRLNVHGAELEEDGDFGILTDRAVRHFQKDAELVVDGLVGPITWGELNDDPAPGEEPGEDA